MYAVGTPAVHVGAISSVVFGDVVHKLTVTLARHIDGDTLS